jgi:hypothetical protein
LFARSFKCDFVYEEDDSKDGDEERLAVNYRKKKLCENASKSRVTALLRE